MSDETRVYLTLQASDLDALAQGEPLTEVPATAVTAALQAAYPQEDDEGLEFLALQEAAAAGVGASRVLVAAADVTSEVEPRSGSTPAAVTVSGVGPDLIVSFHVGDEGAVPAADEAIELSWYDVTELDDVRRLVDG